MSGLSVFINNFSNNKIVLTFLTFILTTIMGTWLNYAIQAKTSEYNRKFEMYKIRLEEAKQLQKDILETMNSRLFRLEQVLIKLANLDQDIREEPFDWPSVYIDDKDKWNTNMIYWHSKLDVLFGETLASELIKQEENQVIFHAKVMEKLKYKSPSPRTVHGAFLEAHSTVQYLLENCQGKMPCKERSKLVNLAKDQIVYLKTISNCFAHHLSGRLLVDPYGPEKVFVLPKGCNFEQGG